LAIFAATERLLASRALRALVGFLGAQAALLYAYSLWSGIKELAAAATVALVCASVATTIEHWHRVRTTLPSALSVAALLAILSPAGAVWLLVPAAVALVVVVPLGLRSSARIAAAVVGAIVVLSVPSIAIARSFLGGASSDELTS